MAGINGFTCGKCNAVFSDPDECMTHFIVCDNPPPVKGNAGKALTG